MMADTARTNSVDKKQQDEVRMLKRAAYRVMARKDNQPASVQEILNEAGLSTRAFYRHFESKEALLVAMEREDSTRSAANLAAAVAGAVTPAAAVDAWLDHWLDLGYDPARLRHARVLSSDEAVALAGRRHVRGEVQRTSVKLLAKVLADGHRAGDFPLAHPADDARAVQAIVLSLLEARVQRESAPSRESARAHVVSVLERLLGGSLSPAAPRRVARTRRVT